ncbi:MAG: hypothetical protein R6V54_00590, partial [Desulfobacteraceae bacterium]
HAIHGCNPPDLIFLVAIWFKLLGVRYVFDHPDMISASIAMGVDVDLLVTLTDVGGVYTGNPKEDDSLD